VQYTFIIQYSLRKLFSYTIVQFLHSRSYCMALRLLKVTSKSQCTFSFCATLYHSRVKWLRKAWVRGERSGPGNLDWSTFIIIRLVRLLSSLPPASIKVVTLDYNKNMVTMYIEDINVNSLIINYWTEFTNCNSAKGLWFKEHCIIAPSSMVNYRKHQRISRTRR